ncbi:cobalamin-dependent protein [Candidatus Bathyarchaeota archaeon]|nr:cobalamin-dependent protein [Candidatus Bathyarchaeota archaeon]
MKILFVEPPKDFWFVMGEYLPPPFGILQLAAYLEKANKDVEIEVLDCQAENIDWKGLERHIENFNPDIVAPSGLATCNAYTVVRAVETAKEVNPEILTVVGGQHFTATAEESLETYPGIDIIVRGEGEQTLVELVDAYAKGKPMSTVKGLSFRHKGKIYHTPERPLIRDLDDLPYPGYHFVEDIIHKYHFTMMAGPSTRYALIEGSRGCPYSCSFCSQWVFWQGKWRVKSPKRIADEMQFVYENYGMRFLWLTDDNFGLGKHAVELCDEIIKRGFADDIMWFMQARCDEVVKHSSVLPKLRKAGNRWILLGVESPSESTLQAFNKKITPEDSEKAIKLLKRNDIFAQATLIIGERKDSAKSLACLRQFVNDIDPDLAIFMILTPFPGTKLYKEAKRNGWIEDANWAHYDMVHAVMSTEYLSRMEVQEELYKCYRSFYGSLPRRLKGIFSSNKLKRKTYRYLASQGVLMELENLFRRKPNA